MNQPSVSVVMAVRNVERFLAEAIESVLGQTFRDFEFIIVDFGSTDRSTSIISSYAAKDIRIRYHEIPTCVLPTARNAGCYLAEGQYIAVMDADDISLPARLEWQVEFMEKHPEVGLLGAATEWIDARGRSSGVHAFPIEDSEIRSTLATRCPFWHPTVFMRRKAFVSVGGYRDAFIFAHDYDLELRISEQFQCSNLKNVVLKYRIHPSQVTYTKQKEQTLCKLAAQVSASSRRERKPDPLDGVPKIGPALLAELGVGEAVQQNAMAAHCRNWIRSMTAVGEYSVALEAATNLLQSERAFVERWQIAELQLSMAELYWKQYRFRKGIFATVQALLTRPAVIGKPLRPLLRRLRLLPEEGANSFEF